MLKKLFLLSVISILVISCSKHDYNQKFSVEPVKRVQGEKATVLFNAKGTKLEDAQQVYVVVYEFNNDLQNVNEYQMTNEGDGLYAEYSTSPDAYGAFYTFSDGDEVKDNNDGEGYLAEYYTEDGKTVPGVEAGIAAAYANWVRAMDMEVDKDKALNLFEVTFKEHPDLKRKFIASYLQLISSLADNTAKELLSRELSEMEKWENLSDEELETLIIWHGRLGNKEKEKHFKEIALEKYPKGKAAEYIMWEEFNNAETLDDKLNLIHKYKTKFPEGAYNESMAFSVLRQALQQNNFDMAFMITQHAGEDLHPYYFSYAANRMLENNYDTEKIISILNAGIKRGQTEVSKPDSAKPKTTTLRNWRESSKYYLGVNYATLGKVLEQKGNKEEALNNIAKAVELTKEYYSNPETNLSYIKLMVELGKEADAKPFIEELVKKGEATSEMKDYLKTCYVKLEGSEDGYADYLAKLESKANSELVTKLKKEMYEEDAPDFTLEDLDGNQVTLSSLKGKTVVIDFWATWCGPCKNSFPGMKKAVEKLEGDDVQFLFVNTWERVDNKKENAANFIKENNYPFHVLLDVNNEAVQKFKVEGIPTKFVVDKNGKIRFKSVGFSGNTDALVDELSAMIELLK